MRKGSEVSRRRHAKLVYAKYKPIKFYYKAMINGIYPQFWCRGGYSEMYHDKAKKVGVSYLRSINGFLVLNLN